MSKICHDSPPDFENHSLFFLDGKQAAHDVNCTCPSQQRYLAALLRP
jgi:hypothetical protein